ncbi:MAG: hypothetical protein AAGA42_10735 [Actinomycetota bacterium]
MNSDDAVTLYVCGRYDGGFRDYQLAELRNTGSRSVAVVRLTRDDSAQHARAELHHAGADVVYTLRTTNRVVRNLAKIVPALPIAVAVAAWKHRPTRIIVTAEGFCFWSVPSAVLRRWVEVFYHDPTPHESAADGAKHRFEIGYRRWVHERKRWKNVLVGWSGHVAPTAERCASTVDVLPFPPYYREMFPPARRFDEATNDGYLLVYGRLDAYKGVYEWLQEVDPHLDRLPPIVVAGRVVDERIFEFADDITIVDRYIEIGEVHDLFDRASAVVLPYTSVTHSSIPSIAGAFGKPTYLSDLGYFRDLHGNDEHARPLDALVDDIAQ